MRIEPTEASTQKAILEYLTVSGIFAFRLNTGSMKIDGRYFQAHSIGKGAADILAFPFGPAAVFGQSSCTLWIEVKSPTGKLSPEQKTFRDTVERIGHWYLMARSVDDVIKTIKIITK
jgi:hypothetical protein